MGKFIVKIKDYYLEWSTIVDGPVTFGMKIEDFKRYYRDMYGEEVMRELPLRLERVEQKGTSAIDHEDINDTIRFNRAGPREGILRINEIYKAYCLMEPIRKGWMVPTVDH